MLDWGFFSASALSAVSMPNTACLAANWSAVASTRPSASIGLMAGLYAAADARAAALAPPPSTTALGSLLGHITGGHIETIDAGPRSFQPMNVNFGLFPPLASAPTKKADGTRLRGNEKTVAKKQAMSARALSDLDRWIADHLRVAAAA